MKYHLFIWRGVNRNHDEQIQYYRDNFERLKANAYRGGFDTLQEAMAYKFKDPDKKDMRIYRAGLFMKNKDGLLSFIRFSYCSRESPWGSFYDVGEFPDKGYIDERR